MSTVDIQLKDHAEITSNSKVQEGMINQKVTEDKFNLTATNATSNKIEDKQLVLNKNDKLYTEILSRHNKNKSIASLNKFDINFPGFDKDDDNISSYINEDNKNNQDVIVNVSNLDMDHSMIQGIERLETLFQTASNRELKEDKEIRKSEQSILSDNNTPKDNKEKDKKKLIEDDTINKRKINPTIKLILIGIMIGVGLALSGGVLFWLFFS